MRKTPSVKRSQTNTSAQCARCVQFASVAKFACDGVTPTDTRTHVHTPISNKQLHVSNAYESKT
eukprot:m.358384 g.358384  ORF g.358384 m.358384 type:complete len:64 (+) comp18136_c0_seq1:2809-3000(+)